MTTRRDILNTADIPTRTIHSGARLEAALGDIDGALGTTQIGATLHVAPAGKTAWPYHRHHGNDEIFHVVSGEGTDRVGERRLPIKVSDLIGAPAGGEAHQITDFIRSTRNPYDHSTIRHLQHFDHKGVDYRYGEPGSEEGKTK